MTDIAGIISFYGPFLALMYLLTVLMIIDCAINRRELYWFFILVVLGPLGGVAYLIYNYDTVTFPCRMSALRNLSARGGLSRGGGRRCGRCGGSVAKLVRFQDGRGFFHMCEACKNELEGLRRAGR